MADNLDPNPIADGNDWGHRRISKKAMRRLDDDTIDKMLLRPERRRLKRSWWRILLHWLTKKRDRSDV